MRLTPLFNIALLFVLATSPVLASEVPSSAPVPLGEEGNFPVGETNDDGAEVNLPPAAISASAKPVVKQPAQEPAVVDNEDTLLQELEKELKPQNYTHSVVLQALNKITARTSPLEVMVGSSIHFGTLEILLKKCWKSSPDETPDSKALLEIWEQKPGEPRTQIFSGWMLASSPAISALEHPVYDITVLECKNK